ncbi:hypothetical protein MPSEU_000032900 [Mayamaea pseudoterrestris]|nr:hypothetical protein MPSEU_000032900 [Mayamaea pseudoterrestris]
MNQQDNSSNQHAAESILPGSGWTNGDITQVMFPYTRNGKLALYQSHRRWIGLDSGGWTRIGDGDPHDARHSSSSSRLVKHDGNDNDASANITTSSQTTSSSALLSASSSDPAGDSARALIAQLCETFYRQNWATGTGGGVCIRIPATHMSNANPSSPTWRVFVAPSGIQKEDMIGDDVFELDMNRNVVHAPKTPGLKQSACTPLWYVVFEERPSAQAVIHTHSMHAQLATLLDQTETSKSLRLTHFEMLKGCGGHAYDDVLEVPIIDNRPSEDLLADQLRAAVRAYPKCNAVLVRRHGLYAWGDSWEQAKTQCESFDYLFQTALQVRQLGIDPSVKPKAGTYRVSEEEAIGGDKEPANKKLKTAAESNAFHGLASVANQADCLSNTVPLLPRDSKILLLDIEGCTTSISFVKNVLFPYVTTSIDEHFHNYTRKELDALEADFIKEAAQLQVPIPTELHGQTANIVKFLVENDVKCQTLKNLQGEMWKSGYELGQLKGHVYSDMKPAMEWAKRTGVSVYIYSSGSIEAQKLLFGNSIAGDLLPFVKGHFDISTAGNKKDAASYAKIAKSLNVDPSLIVFCSDAEAELVAAREAGIGWPVMSIRPGNAVLTATGKQFPAIYSLLQLCGED